MKRILILLAFLPLLITACAENPTTGEDNSGIINPSDNVYIKSSLPINSINNMTPNGSYTISVFEEEKWQDAGVFLCDKFYRDQRIRLPNLTDKKHARIRISQAGGGAAQIDFVSLSGSSPDSVSGSENGLKKLINKDHDVLDVFGMSIECIFPAGGTELLLNARIEHEVLDKTPVNIPEQNMHKEPEEFRFFYQYKSLEKKLNITEYCLSGSGHPNGFVYIEVKSDESNLYIDADFTPDNTLDGSLDYAKVYLKTKRGLKEFKITTEEKTWGSTEFIYTDRVEYQHKVYHFTIPLTAIDLPDDSLIELTFAFYGTTSGQTFYDTDIAYNSTADNFLIVYQKDDTGLRNIYGQLLATDGTLIGSEFLIENTSVDHCTHPTAAYNAVNNNYLVAWEDRRADADSDIYGQIVPADGNIGTISNFIINGNSGTGQNEPKAAWDSVNNRYLVVWGDYGSTNYIRGQLVTAAGTLSSPAFSIDTTEYDQWNPELAFNPDRQEYLVVWYRDDYGATSDNIICGNIVSESGSPSAATLTFSTSNTYGKSFPDVEYNPAAENYLVIWQENDSSDMPDILGRIVNSNGTAAGSELVIRDINGDQILGPALAYDSFSNTYIVVWRDDRNTEFDLFALYPTAAGTVSGADIEIDTSAGFQGLASVCCRTNFDNHIIGYMDSATTPTTISFSATGTGAEAPSVTGHTAGSTADTDITVTFSKAMDKSLTEAAFSLKDGAAPGTAAVSGTFSWNSSSLEMTFDPAAELSTSGTYTYAVDSAAKDQDGNILWNNLTNTEFDVYNLPTPVYPADAAAEIGKEVTFVWKAPPMPNGQTAVAKLYTGTDNIFTGITPIEVTGTPEYRFMLAGIGLFGAMLTAGALLGSRKMKSNPAVYRTIVIIGIIIILSAAFAACSPEDNPPALNDGEMSYTITDLERKTTYYWKVVYEFSSGASSECGVQSFTTY